MGRKKGNAGGEEVEDIITGNEPAAVDSGRHSVHRYSCFVTCWLVIAPDLTPQTIMNIIRSQ